MRYDVAGDPMTGIRWTRRTTGKIAQELNKLGIRVCRVTIARLLKDMGFSLRVNQKKINRASNVNRNEQFEYIASLREEFARHGDPVISVDTKKKELIGQFKNAGTTWSREPVLVNDHDFRSDALGLAVPYGILDVGKNSAAVFVGTSHDTPQFAVSSIAGWWRHEGRRNYRNAKNLLILADNGGSNGSSSYAWKYFLQDFCNETGLSVTVCHYPSGTSKWNPIEHRLFSEISKNWAGRPLDSFETCLNYIGTTRTATGLKVAAFLDTSRYPKGVKISKGEMALLQLRRHETFPKMNYTLSPQPRGLARFRRIARLRRRPRWTLIGPHSRLPATA